MSNQIIEYNAIPVDAELDAQLGQGQLLDEEELSLRVDSRRDERCLAFYLLYAVDRSDYEIALDDVIADFTQEYEVVLPENTFYKELCDGVIAAREDLDVELKPYLKNWRIERLGCCTRLILRLALWEMRVKKTPATVIINEAVELAKSFAEKDAFKFINGVLDEVGKTMYQTRSSSDHQA